MVSICSSSRLSISSMLRSICLLSDRFFLNFGVAQSGVITPVYLIAGINKVGLILSTVCSFFISCIEYLIHLTQQAFQFILHLLAHQKFPESPKTFPWSVFHNGPAVQTLSSRSALQTALQSFDGFGISSRKFFPPAGSRKQASCRFFCK